jgi:hypothetical protein
MLLCLFYYTNVDLPWFLFRTSFPKVVSPCQLKCTLTCPSSFLKSRWQVDFLWLVFIPWVAKPILEVDLHLLLYETWQVNLHLLTCACGKLTCTSRQLAMDHKSTCHYLEHNLPIQWWQTKQANWPMQLHQGHNQSSRWE